MKRTAALLLVVFSACCFGSIVWAQSVPTTGGANAIAFPPVSMLMHCNEMVARYLVNAEAARRVVPREYILKLTDNGSATLMLPIQECSDIEDTVYGLHTGTAGLAHAWIEIQPPPNAIAPDPVPGVFNLPTMYWYYVQGQTDNLIAAARLMLSGVQVEVVDQVSLGGRGPGIRQGQVVEREYPLHVTYTWQETSGTQLMLPPSTGVTHVLYRKQMGVTGRTLVTGTVRCLLSLYGMGTSKLTADRFSLIGRMGFGTEISAWITLDFDQGCTVDFQTESVN